MLDLMCASTKFILIQFFKNQRKANTSITLNDESVRVFFKNSTNKQ